MDEFETRDAKQSDAPVLLDIYNHYVLNTPVTFDIQPRTLAQRETWLAQFAARGRYRCLVGLVRGELVGWACSTRFKEREAYATSVETSVYCAPGWTGQRIGRRLYDALFAALAHEDIHRAYAGITQPNQASNRLHETLGFRSAGTYSEVGRKFGRYWDVAVYERAEVSRLRLGAGTQAC